MSDHRHIGALGFFAVAAAIAFAFGASAARTFVGTVLIAGALCFAYVMYRIVMGTI